MLRPDRQMHTGIGKKRIAAALDVNSKGNTAQFSATRYSPEKTGPKTRN